MNKLLFQIALTQIKGVGDITARHLVDAVGDEEAIFKSSKKSLLAIQGISHKIVDEILKADVLSKAEKELEFIQKNKIQTFYYKDNNYPIRLKECIDAPILFYFKGQESNFDRPKVISLVGTRKATHYGNQFCEDFLSQLSSLYPDILIVSGLAYGIDIAAHKSALTSNLSTVGVLAHGLDRIYPSAHRKTAVDMLAKGGILTEFISGTEPDKFNFVRRNRIIAGLSDAVIVVESDVKGGSLITADIANSYDREVFAVPGRITDPYSKGCNNLIVQNRAIMLQSAETFLQAMNWDLDDMPESKKVRQKSLFLDLTDIEEKIYQTLSGVDSMDVNLLSTEIGIPVSQLFFTLLELEMKNVIKPLPGNLYQLV